MTNTRSDEKDLQDDPDNMEKSLAVAQLDRVSDALYMAGFRQGLSDGQEAEHCQVAFDAGYKEFFTLSKDISVIRSTLAVTLTTFKGREPDAKRLEALLAEATQMQEALAVETSQAAKDDGWDHGIAKANYPVMELRAKVSTLMEEINGVRP